MFRSLHIFGYYDNLLRTVFLEKQFFLHKLLYYFLDKNLKNCFHTFFESILNIITLTPLLGQILQEYKKVFAASDVFTR
jgi:hypothetical protein